MRIEMKRAQWVVGNEPIARRLNVRSELARFRQNPLFRFLRLIGTDQTGNRCVRLEPDFGDSLSPAGRFLQAYRFYYLALNRALPEISVMARGDRFFKYAKGYEYTPFQRELAKRYHPAERYIEYDLLCCILYSRILADRTIALSRYFLTESKLPSFTSFNEHKKFFRKLQDQYGDHEEYATYVREKTGWFDSLKTVRDDFVVHHGKAKHYGMLGYGSSDNDVTLFFIPHEKHMVEFETKYKGILVQLSVRRLSRDINGFLKWFDAYGSKVLRDRQLKHIK